MYHVKKARKDNPVAKAGEPYYWWKFRYGGKRDSSTYPKPSQLSQSEYLRRLFELQEQRDKLGNLRKSSVTLLTTGMGMV